MLYILLKHQIYPANRSNMAKENQKLSIWSGKLYLFCSHTVCIYLPKSVYICIKALRIHVTDEWKEWECNGGGRSKNDVDEMPSGVLSKGNLLKQGYNHTPNIEEMLLAFV